jgi:RasGEF domain
MLRRACELELASRALQSLAAPDEPTYASWRAVPLPVLAAQWTFQDHALFCAIPVGEMVAASFDDPRSQHAADGVRACIDRYNAQWLWVASEVVAGASPDARAATWLRFLALGVRLHKLHNFGGLAAVLSGLGAAEVSRLADTMARVPAEAADTLTRLQNVMSSKFFSKSYLAALAAVPPPTPAVPHLGPHNQQITAKALHCPARFPSRKALLHTTRWHELYGLVAPLAELQERSYTLRGKRRILDAPIRSVCAILDLALRPHVHHEPDAILAARERIRLRSLAAEPESSARPPNTVRFAE